MSLAESHGVIAGFDAFTVAPGPTFDVCLGELRNAVRQSEMDTASRADGSARCRGGGRWRRQSEKRERFALGARHPRHESCQRCGNRKRHCREGRARAPDRGRRSAAGRAHQTPRDRRSGRRERRRPDRADGCATGPQCEQDARAARGHPHRTAARASAHGHRHRTAAHGHRHRTSAHGHRHDTAARPLPRWRAAAHACRCLHRHDTATRLRSNVAAAASVSHRPTSHSDTAREARRGRIDRAVQRRRRRGRARHARLVAPADAAAEPRARGPARRRRNRAAAQRRDDRSAAGRRDGRRELSVDPQRRGIGRHAAGRRRRRARRLLPGRAGRHQHRTPGLVWRGPGRVGIRLADAVRLRQGEERRRERRVQRAHERTAASRGNRAHRDAGCTDRGRTGTEHGARNERARSSTPSRSCSNSRGNAPNWVRAIAPTRPRPKRASPPPKRR
jgi:hypothetical protein